MALIRLCEQLCDESGKEDEPLASAYNELGVAHMMNNKYVEGMEAFKKSIDIYHRLETSTKDDTAFPLANLGLSYWLQSKYEKAEQVLLGALRDREAAFGPGDRESLK